MDNSRLTKDIITGFEKVENAINNEKGRITKAYSKGKITLSEMTNQLLLIDMIISFLQVQKRLNLPSFASIVETEYSNLPNSMYASSEHSSRHGLEIFSKGISKGLE